MHSGALCKDAGDARCTFTCGSWPGKHVDEERCVYLCVLRVTDALAACVRSANIWQAGSLKVNKRWKTRENVKLCILLNLLYVYM